MASHLAHKDYRDLTPEEQDYIDREGGPFYVIHPRALCVFDYWSEAWEFALDLQETYDGNKSRATVYHSGQYT
jgi:hypothetical protein